jgi:hypothetical protein
MSSSAVSAGIAAQQKIIPSRMRRMYFLPGRIGADILLPAIVPHPTAACQRACERRAFS